MSPELRTAEILNSQKSLERKILEQRDFILKKFKKDNYGDDKDNVYRAFTEEQTAELDSFWDKLKYIYEADHTAIEPFYNISGIFDKRYIPYEFMENYLRPQFYNEDYRVAFQDKTYISEIFPNIKQPSTIIRKIDGLYYNNKFENISLETAANIVYNFTNVGKEILIKPNLSTMGLGIKFIKSSNLNELKSTFIKYGNFIIQEVVKQHEDMAYLNENTVNTVRITTFLLDAEIIPLAALVRVGAPNKRVDNWHQGGSIIGLNLCDGSTLPWALGNNIQKITKLPSGAVVGKDGFKKVPYFDKVIDLVKKAHYKVPMFKLISWDIAIGEDGNPLMLEFNVRGDITIHEMLTGPLFGDYTEQIIRKYVLEKQSKAGVFGDFEYAEFEKHVKIIKYMGKDNSVIIVPDSINSKPVITIGLKSFESLTHIEEVILPKSVKVIQTEAFKDCKNLKKIDCDINNISYAKSAFTGCDALKW